MKALWVVSPTKVVAVAHRIRSFDRPEIMHMREMIDNPELPKVAALLLVYVTAVTPPVHLVEPLIKILVSTLRESTVS